MIFNKKNISGRKKSLQAKSGKRISRLKVLIATILLVVIAGTGVIGVCAMYGTYKEKLSRLSE